jgi:hypothetical protein
MNIAVQEDKPTLDRVAFLVFRFLYYSQYKGDVHTRLRLIIYYKYQNMAFDNIVLMYHLPWLPGDDICPMVKSNLLLQKMTFWSDPLTTYTC